jgi:hypothetical protein
MMAIEQRVVHVDKYWYAQLLEYLQPEERWANDAGHIFLYSCPSINFSIVKLVFVPVDVMASSSTPEFPTDASTAQPPTE